MTKPKVNNMKYDLRISWDIFNGSTRPTSQKKTALVTYNINMPTQIKSADTKPARGPKDLTIHKVVTK